MMGRGSMTRLEEMTGISYQTIHSLATDKHRAREKTAAKISAATRGLVSIEELQKLPGDAPRPRLATATRRSAASSAAE